MGVKQFAIADRRCALEVMDSAVDVAFEARLFETVDDVQVVGGCDVAEVTACCCVSEDIETCHEVLAASSRR